MKVSIIIPCFNEENTIFNIIHSVRKNINQNDEIIVIDDCSFDKTREILKKDLSKNIDCLIFTKKIMEKVIQLEKE